ncbi:LPS assembly lipoprotein LptE [sulfur-oxidizing endosymbiont of Gigantopelta aegis]|uniref:LPS-assembly lipoprotein LptE n=1 Tax=sulfur-oxidizing endosymbiont of Gigantopelta aegis TaxID=2794934 RepID=UPI0018DE3912|nr:LPS assembly lipoprotein LptE [sulfur-oxidizing endosymbiont of Gigantopelta aegis]
MKQTKNMNAQNNHRFRAHFKLLSLILLLSIVSGCGFQLRGNIVLPPLYKHVHVVTQGNDDVGEALSKALTNVGSVIVPSPAAATSVVTVLSSGTQRRAINVAGNTIREYELQLNISFVVQDGKGVQLADQQTVSVVRNFQNDPNNVLGKDNEEKLIRKEMMGPAIIQVLRRMKAIAQ